ncbi:DNA distortion polypeptide 3 [Escherichia coli]|uniref:DNA distortion polypeptide 3 n=1 Tax=Escherichia coli TaxID=562 RepID=UPI000D0A931F|nr:DNA distortion polypeptide 3 [Escherichia coli]EFB6224616.1 DNA distortion polypeptide 3 [Escherichia coli]EFJ3097656.1 DNA distortion polypeptide 3 [Escherichia coli]EFN5366815.1 DNA distortion polypeptide 3 [Escherichia coli]EGI4447611.1 DNA distortion polypeptide 3 [Escherichia coli]
MTSLTPFRNVCPVTYSRFLLENFMKYQMREFITDKYAKAVNILKDNLKENYHVFYGVRLSEILFPVSEYGTEQFFSDFEKINSISLPVLVFDLKAGVPVIVISLDDVSYCDVLNELDIDFMKCESLAELLTSDKLENLFV